MRRRELRCAISLSWLLLQTASLRPPRREVCRGLIAGSSLASLPASAVPRYTDRVARSGGPGAATLETVEGPGTDGRAYGLLSLPDGARCLLASAAPSLTFDGDRGNVLAGQAVEVAVTVGCGSMRDPDDWEGLAHLAEHVTLASAAGVRLTEWVDEREGEVNGFTEEERTTFTFQLGRPDEPRGEAEEAADVSQLCALVADLFDCWRASPLPADEAVVREEIRRVDAELEATRTDPSKSLIECGQYKARANPASRWARLARGSKATLPAARVPAICRAVDELRTSGYTPLSISLAIVSPLPLSLSAAIATDAFRRRAPLLRPAPRPPRRGPPPFGAGWDASPCVVERPGRYPCLTVGWCVPVDDPVAAARCKPLAVLGHALTSPHAGSASDVLRTAGIAPLSAELEPCLTARAVSSAEGWALWELSLLMNPGAERRWREARDVLISAVGVASRGVPAHLAAEAKSLALLGWRYSSRAPSAIELSRDLQDEPSPPLALLTGHTFVGDAQTVADAATDAARRALSFSEAVVTLYCPSLDGLGPLAQLGPLLQPSAYAQQWGEIGSSLR
uniref:Peptidase M16 N-terminal domain-containing protein n=1 Tax=Emiliania huxleyi TaxID=2903 RepID=A0A6V2UER8_EMIHU